MTRFEYTLPLEDVDDTDEALGEARMAFEGVGLGGIVYLVKMARGDVCTLGSRGERDGRSGDEERGEDTAGV